MTFLTIIGVIGSIISPIVSPIIAHHKKRSVVGWIFGGLFLGWLGLIIIACLSDLSEKEK